MGELNLMQIATHSTHTMWSMTQCMALLFPSTIVQVEVGLTFICSEVIVLHASLL